MQQNNYLYNRGVSLRHDVICVTEIYVDVTQVLFNERQVYHNATLNIIYVTQNISRNKHYAKYFKKPILMMLIFQ